MPPFSRVPVHYSTHTLFICCRLQCVIVINVNYQRSPETEQFITAKISGNALKQGSRTHSVLRQCSSQVQKHKVALMSRRIAVDQNQRRSQGGGAEGAQAHPLAIRILMFIFLVIHQHCKSRSGVLQNVLRQYHKA